MMKTARSPDQLGELMRQARKAKSQSQSDVGRTASVTQKTISRLENGDDAIQLATLFDVLTALDLELVVQPRTESDAADIEDIF